MDVVYPLAVVTTAECHMVIYNFTNPAVEYKVCKRVVGVITIIPMCPLYLSAANPIASAIPEPKLA
jgi:hypothetical protein